MKVILTTLAIANLILIVTSHAADTTVHPVLTLDGARKAADAAVAYAKANGAPGSVIAVVDDMPPNPYKGFARLKD